MSEFQPHTGEFDPTALRWATVECISCDERYICTPYSDYYGSNGVTNNDAVFVDGRCEECLAENGYMIFAEDIDK